MKTRLACLLLVIACAKTGFAQVSGGAVLIAPSVTPSPPIIEQFEFTADGFTVHGRYGAPDITEGGFSVKASGSPTHVGITRDRAFDSLFMRDNKFLLSLEAAHARGYAVDETIIYSVPPPPPATVVRKAYWPRGYWERYYGAYYAPYYPY